LHQAAHSGHAEVTSLLLADPRTTIDHRLDSGETPLHVAAKQGHAAVVRVLLADPRIDVNAVDKYESKTSLAMAREKVLAGQFESDPAARERGRAEVVALLEADPRVIR
jgi:ankyrin repeat protein